MSEQVNASSKAIYVYVTIVAEEVMQHYPKNNTPSDPKFIDHKYGYMVVGNARGAENQGTGDLKFNAKRGDQVRFVGSTSSDNFDEVALINKISHLNGETVITNFDFLEYTDYPVPNINNKIDRQNFYFYKGEVSKVGTENYNVHFILYTRDDNNNPELYGYFAWDPQIIVKG